MMRFRVTTRYPAELAGTKWTRSVVDVQRSGTEYGPKLDEKLFNQCQCLVLFKDIEILFVVVLMKSKQVSRKKQGKKSVM